MIKQWRIVNYYTNINKDQESPSKQNSASRSGSQGVTAFSFSNNRPEAATFQKTQETIANSPQVSSLNILQKKTFNGSINGQAALLQAKPASSFTNNRYPVQRTEINDDISPSYAVTAKKDEQIGEGEETTKAMVHRGLVETEVHDCKKYVRAYQTVYASNDNNSTWKDTQQASAPEKANQKIVFKGKGDTWINFGQPLRALHYIRTYKAQADNGKREQAWQEVPVEQRNDAKRKEIERMHGQPIIRSFLVPFEVYKELTDQSISESQRKDLGDYTMNVDKSKASDQYQIVGGGVKKLQQTALAGSLISYVLDSKKGDYAEPHHGTVKGFKELTDMLGLPEVFDPLMGPMDESKVPSAKDQALRAEELNRLIDLSYFAEKQSNNPNFAARPIGNDAYWSRYAAAQKALEPLAKKYLNTDSLPDTKQERDQLRIRLAAAANAALIPSLIEGNYEEGTAKMYADDRNEQTTRANELRELLRLSYFAEKQSDNPNFAGRPISKDAYWSLYANAQKALEPLAKKYLNTDSLPDTKQERDELRNKIQASIDKAEQRSQLNGEARPLSRWMNSQVFEDKKLASLVKNNPLIIGPPDEAEIQRRREAKQRNKPASTYSDSDDDFMPSLFD